MSGTGCARAVQFSECGIATLSACMSDIAKHLLVDAAMITVVGLLCNSGKFQCHSVFLIREAVTSGLVKVP